MLKIQAVQRSDSGTYSCVAKNSAGEDTSEIVLEVLGTSVVHNYEHLSLYKELFAHQNIFLKAINHYP